jgi:hypothetical protein
MAWLRANDSIWRMWVAFCILCMVITGTIAFHISGPEQAYRNLPDDTYYYYVPLRNMAAGQGISFDGRSLTNGFHPLWFAILSPFAANDDLPRIAVLFGLIFGWGAVVVTGLTIWRITKHRFVTMLVVGFMFANPYWFSASTNGLESGLHMLCVAWLIERTSALVRRDPLPLGHGLLFGLVIGVAFLSRTDTVFLIGICGFAVLFSHFKPQRLIILALGAIPALFLAAPWLIWNQNNFGGILQSSGEALATVMRLLWESNGGGASPTPSLIGLSLVNSGIMFSVGGLWWGSVLILPIILQRRQLPFHRGWLILALAYSAGYITFHQIARWLVRDWYYAGPLPVLYIGIACAMVLIWPWLKGIPRLIMMISLFIGGWLGLRNNPIIFLIERYPDQIQMQEAAVWLRANVPQGTVVGSFNAGILSFYGDHLNAGQTPGPVVINLDGVVNSPAMPFIERRDLFCYMKQEGITHLVDFADIPEVWQPILAADGKIPENVWEFVYQRSPTGGGNRSYMVAKLNQAVLATHCSQ